MLLLLLLWLSLLLPDNDPLLAWLDDMSNLLLNWSLPALPLDNDSLTARSLTILDRSTLLLYILSVDLFPSFHSHRYCNKIECYRNGANVLLLTTTLLNDHLLATLDDAWRHRSLLLLLLLLILLLVVDGASIGFLKLY